VIAINSLMWAILSPELIVGRFYQLSYLKLAEEWSSGDPAGAPSQPSCTPVSVAAASQNQARPL
jgi:hypothetical protein